MNTTKTKHSCSKCGSENVELVTGVSIGDPLKDRKTDFVILSCKDCKKSTAVRIDYEKGKVTVSTIENNNNKKTEEEPK